MDSTMKITPSSTKNTPASSFTEASLVNVERIPQHTIPLEKPRVKEYYGLLPIARVRKGYKVHNPPFGQQASDMEETGSLEGWALEEWSDGDGMGMQRTQGVTLLGVGLSGQIWLQSTVLFHAPLIYPTHKK